jgi:YHS domain-containing protein
MARVIIWIILAAIVIRIAWQFIHAILEGAGLRRTTAAPPSVKLVRDPVCGTFVVPGKALTAGYGPATQYFCSEKCRKEWKGQ